MINYSESLKKISEKILDDQSQHLRNNKDVVFDAVSKTSTFNDKFIDNSRCIKNMIDALIKEVEEIEKWYNKPEEAPKE
jgi:hypothetical protein